ncbi:UvrD-helicase domain-containing protein [Thiobacter aerophilum]|uniref:DNA 3'-5' helicase n=1 Tax=Thiobacter aerophilum TaxID=3121275 RepID=A0ABV0EHR4_9BURK
MSSASGLVRQALDPHASVVVEACAGSGKTWLLVSRILRLLLAGAEPSQILAITFTRKAAQEMQARLNAWLRMLATCTEGEAREFLLARGLTAQALPDVLPRARHLFEHVAAAEPGPTIDTFHGWFLKILRHAPLAFAAAGNVTLLEHTAALREQAWQDFADRLAAQPDGPEAQALGTLFREWSLSNTRKALDDFLHKRTEWQAYTRGADDPLAHAAVRLRETLGHVPGRDAVAEFFAAGGEEDAHFLAHLMAQGTEKQRTCAATLARDGRADEDYFLAIREVALTREGTLRKEWVKLAERHGGPEALQRCERLAQRLRDVEEARLVARIQSLNEAALRCGAAYSDHYQRLKEARGALDFADIELFAWRLLAQGDYAEYLQYKLDARYRHILLDEFQDTNPVQWQILKTWLAAAEAADRRPTVFLVGDPKQSIYRFRGAEARLFDLAKDWLMRHYGAVYLAQDESRRCAPAVIDLVNRVFQDVSDFPHFRSHTAHDATLPGGVLVLPLAQVQEEAAAPRATLRDPLREPRPEDQDAHALEASQLAATLRDLVGRLPVREGKTERPARFRDIMVLTRTRTPLIHFEQAFKAAGIPYLTARQGGLLDTLEAADLTALLEFLVLPFADLRLAQVLKSPLFGADDADLLLLAGRNERTWWQRLTALVAEGQAPPCLARAAEHLDRWRSLTDRLPVHDLLDRIYFEGELHARYAAAVPAAQQAGVQANLHAFLELALKIQSGRYPSLPRFLQELAALREAGEEAPDEGTTDAGGDAVRIHTIHGAKGLEAPIVCLIDAQRRPNANDSYRVLVKWPPGADAPTHFSFYTKQDERDRARLTFLQEEARLTRNEELNLLYVALTRAKQYLIVSGSGKPQAESGYGRILAARCSHPLDLATLPPPVAATAPPAPIDAPVAPPAATAVGRRLAPVHTPAIQRGIALHRILEVLTTPAGPHLDDALRRELGLAQPEFEALLEEAKTLLTAPQLARFFADGQYRRAVNELSYVGQDGELRRIDRLVEFDDEVWILDYKMGESAPANPPAAYRAQLAAYRAAMAPIYPERRVRAAVIFADGRLMEILADDMRD